MAEYKGLTIRIGGDTSQLNSALKASTKSAASLQREIRQITRAMRFDPTDLKNVDTRMRLTTNRAESLYSKMRLLKSAYGELGDTVVSVGGSATSVRKLSESTENIALAASAAKERYNDMTKNLAANYRELEARAKAAGKSMNLNALSRQGSDDTFERQMARLRELGVITDEEIQKLREMRAVWGEAFDSSEAYKAASQLEGMAVDMQRFESEARNAAATVRELNTVSRYSGDSWQESTARIRSMDSALSECAKQASAYEAALRRDPSSLTAALGRLKALANEYDLAEGKASELTRQVAAYRSRLSGVVAEHRNLPKYIQETGDRWQKAQDELSQAKGEASALRQSLQRLKDMQAPVDEIRQLEAEITKADRRVDALRESAAQMDAAFETAKECAELQRLEGELTEASARARSLKERMDLTSLGGKNMLNPSTLKSAGMTMYSTLTPAITMLGWRAVTAAQDIDSAYRDMRKTVDGSELQFEQLKQAAIEFSKTHVTSADQILNIEAIGGELGIATENLQAFAETVSNLDVATNLETEEAASSLGKLANITHMGADEYDSYADALVRLGNNGASTEDQIVDIATRIGSMGTIVGMTVPEILALSSSIASTGMKTEASGTAIANTMSDIESAVNGAEDDLYMFAKTAGMTSEEFAKTWENDPVQALKSFVEGLNEIEKNGGSADSTLEDLGITGTRQKQAILGLMQTIGGLNDNLAMSQDAWDGVSDEWGAAGDAAREAEKKAEGFSGQLSILANVGNDAMAALAEGATPIVSVFTDLAKSALDMFEEMDEGSKTTIVLGLGIAALAGPALTMVSTFMTAAGNVRAFVTESNAMGKALNIMRAGFIDTGFGADGMKLKMASLGEAAKTVGKSMLSGLATGAVVVGITVAVSAIVDYIDKMEKAKEAAMDAGDAIESALGGVLIEQGKAVNDFSTDYDGMVSKMAESNRKIQESANDTYGKNALIEEYAEGVKEALDAYNDGDRSAESMANLKTQLELYNDAAGTSITVSEKTNGKLKLMKDGAKLTADAFDELTQSIMNSAKAEFFKDSYSTKMGDYRDALDEVAKAEARVKGARDALVQAQQEPGTSQEQLDQLQQNYDTAVQGLEDTKQKLGETQSAMNQYEEGMKLMAAATAAGAQSAQQWVADNDAVQATIWNNGQSVTGFSEALGKLNLDYDTLSANSDVVKSMAESWDSTFASILPGLTQMGVKIDEDTAKVMGLDSVKVGDKTFYVSDDGTIVEEDGKLAELKGLTIGDKTYRVSDDGTIWDGVNAVGTLKDDVASLPDGKVKVTATVDPATSKVTGWVQKVNSTKASVKADADTSEGKKKVSDLISDTNKSEGTVDVAANTFKFYSAVGKINGSTVGTAYINVAKKAGSYTGGYSRTPWDLSSAAIPKMATGAIVTGPLLTNNGWVGEAGAEAVLNWGTGGTVVPLTNHKYMEPIAKAIAANMGGGQGGSGGSTVNLTVNLAYDSTAEARQMAQDVADHLNAALRMRG